MHSKDCDVGPGDTVISNLIFIQQSLEQMSLLSATKNF
jgi:hypothetical protein